VSPSAEKVQCPFCLGHPRVKGDGTMYAHDYGRRGYRKRCPGAGRTKDDAKAAKSAGPPYEVLSGPPDLVTRPEDIF
jgi:hypothetical protein